MTKCTVCNDIIKASKTGVIHCPTCGVAVCIVCNTPLTDRGTCPNWRRHPNPNAGRPPLDEPASGRNVNLYDRQWEHIEVLAESSGTSVSEALRSIIDSAQL